MSDQYFENVVMFYRPLAAGAVPSTDKIGRTITTTGNSAVTTDAGSITGVTTTFDGTGDYLETPGDNALQLGAGDFSLDLYIKTSGANVCLLDYFDSSSTGWQLFITSAGYLQWWNGASVSTGNVAVNTGSRVHVAVERYNGRIYIYTGGTKNTGDAANTTNHNTNKTKMGVGAQIISRAPTYDFPGVIDYVRITVGVSRWQGGASFTPPTLENIAPQYVRSIDEPLSMDGMVDVMMANSASVTELIYLPHFIGHAWMVSASAALQTSDAASQSVIAGRVVTESMSLSAAAAASGLFSALVSEAAAFVDASASSGRFNAKAIDGMLIFEAQLLHDKLDDLLSVWVANLATAAHSRYAQYGFNSFAQFGGKHYGCKSDGIYELIGDMDGAAPIPWTATLPETDFGMDEIKRLPYVFIGAKAFGNLVLKVIKSPSQIYHFDVVMSLREGRAGRAQLAKGLEGRYWRVEIASDTERVELDSIEFHPVKVSRRV